MSDDATLPVLPDTPPAADTVGERLRRLHQLGVQRGRAGLRPPSRGDQPTAAPAEETAQPVPASPALPDLLPIEQRVGGQIVVTPYGPCMVAETIYPLTTVRGGVALQALLARSGAAVAACARDQAMARFSFRQAAFLDTETTGLAGGAGTFAFMVGIGTFERAQPLTGLSEEHRGRPATRDERGTDEGWVYVVRQVFMRNPAEERALLHVTSNILAGRTGLVSFNGRAFDAPLLTTRFAMHREPSALDGLLHLDLLPAARQRWRLRLLSCAMGNLEKEILAFQRSEEDVPGWLIPSLYQDYARTGDSTAMARVFYHNREDVVNMVPLAAILSAPFEAAGQVLPDLSLDPIDAVSLGRCYEELGWLAQSEQTYRLALAYPLPSDVRSHALSRLGWLLKRQERRSEAAAVWQDWITSVSDLDPTPYVELAKHYEWHAPDLTAARKWTLWALHNAHQLPASPAQEQLLTELQHRLARIESKLSPTDTSGTHGA